MKLKKLSQFELNKEINNLIPKKFCTIFNFEKYKSCTTSTTLLIYAYKLTFKIFKIVQKQGLIIIL